VEVRVLSVEATFTHRAAKRVQHQLAETSRDVRMLTIKNTLKITLVKKFSENFGEKLGVKIGGKKWGLKWVKKRLNNLGDKWCDKLRHNII
jgi:hypothetical protein